MQIQLMQKATWLIISVMRDDRGNNDKTIGKSV